MILGQRSRRHAAHDMGASPLVGFADPGLRRTVAGARRRALYVLGSRRAVAAARVSAAAYPVAPPIVAATTRRSQSVCVVHG